MIREWAFVIQRERNPMKESVVFYKSFYDAIKKIPEEYQLELYNAIFMYSFEDIEPTNLSSIAEVIFTLTKPNIDSAQRKYKASVENGNKGGRPKKNNQSKTQQKPDNNPKSIPNHNLNDNVDDTVNANETVYGNSTDTLSYQEILAIAKEECPVIHKRHIDKANNKMNMSTERKVFELLDRLNGTYTYHQLKEIFRKASKMYCSEEKYKGCDLVWLLNNLTEIEQTKLEEEQPNKKLGFTLCACDIGEVEI